MQFIKSKNPILHEYLELIWSYSISNPKKRKLLLNFYRVFKKYKIELTKGN
jgi:hypothetical protein